MKHKHKAFLGAVIGAVGGLAQGLIQKHEQDKAQRAAAIQQNRQATFNQAIELTNARVNDNEIYNEFADRLDIARLGCSKRRRVRKAEYGTTINDFNNIDTDLIARSNMLRCGGRRCRK